MTHPTAAAAAASASTNAASPPRGLFRRLVKPKMEDKKKAPEWQAPPDYVRAAINMAAPEDGEEFPGLNLAIAASIDDVPPVPDDVADAWSAREHEAEQIARQQRILEEQRAAERAAARAAAPRRRIPPPPPPPEYYILDPSDEDEGASTAPGPSRWHGGDDGEGPSRPAGDSDDGDGGDYTVFYSQLGM